jgi:hypothetical protein
MAGSQLFSDRLNGPQPASNGRQSQSTCQTTKGLGDRRGGRSPLHAFGRWAAKTLPIRAGKVRDLMKNIYPSEVVRFIDEVFPWAAVTFGRSNSAIAMPASSLHASGHAGSRFSIGATGDSCEGRTGQRESRFRQPVAD